MISVAMTIPKNLFPDIPALVSDLTTVVNWANQDSLKDFNATIQAFSAASKFKFQVSPATRREGRIAASVSTDNENYIRLNNGTEDHMVGRGGKMMSFYPGYIRKTQPGVLSSRSSRSFGKRQRAKGPWKVRGITAGEWDRFIVEDTAPTFYRKIDAVIATHLK